MKRIQKFLILLFAVIAFNNNAQVAVSMCGDANAVYQNTSTPIIYDGQATPGGFFDKAYDRYGNAYSYGEITINSGSSGYRPASGVLTCTAGYFIAHFAIGSGMELQFDVTHIARRSVICELLNNISGFINPSLIGVAPINSAYIHILVDNIFNYNPNAATAGVLGLASSYYTFPLSPTSMNPGISENQIFKTIVSQQNAYNNVALPLNVINNPGIYHGYMAFNFSNLGLLWNYNLGVNPAPTEYDLYTVALHEITHALGFASLIDGNNNGFSKFGAANNYYSRYDLFLRSAFTQTLLLNTQGSCSNQYGLAFNVGVSPSVLGSPNCTSVPTNSTNCALANNYNSFSNPNIPVYTPNCFEPPSTLSHFEDLCYPPFINDGYFTMSNAIYPGVIKRYLKAEERNVLCDLGYSVMPTYTSVATGATFNYGGLGCASPIIWGANDGIANGNYLFTTYAASLNPSPIVIPISSVTINDAPNAFPLNVICVENVYANTGTVSLNLPFSINFTPAVNYSGPVLIRYIPVDNAGNQGNITYIYGYVYDYFACIPVTPCNIVGNGDFENPFFIPCGPISIGVGPACWRINTYSPDRFVRGCNTNTLMPANLGNNTYNMNPMVNSHNGTPNNSIIGLAGNFLTAPINPTNTAHYRTESLWTILTSSLITGQVYDISFWAYQKVGSFTDPSPPASTYTSNASFIPMVLSFASYTGGPFNPNQNTPFPPPASQSILSTTLNLVFNAWQFYSFTFTYTPAYNSSYFALGVDGAKSYSLISQTLGVPAAYLNYVFIDEINLTPLNVSLNLPPNICSATSLTNLAQYLSPSIPGVFTGSMVTVNGLQYDFNTALSLPNGTYSIAFTYTNNLGCVITTNGYTTIGNTGSISFNISSNASCVNNQATITPSPANTYTWIPSVGSPTVTNILIANQAGPVTYTVIGINAGCTLTNTVTVITYTVLPIFNVQANPSIVCNGQSSTLTATGNGLTYVWTPTSTPGNTFVVNVSYTNNPVFTVTATNSLTGCSISHTIQLELIPCACFVGCTNTISTNPITNPTINTQYCVTNDVYITNNISFIKSDFKIYPGKTIFITPTGTLNIMGSHLYGCGDLWNGIIVEPGGVLNIIPFTSKGYQTALIEDAKLAAHVLTYTLANNATNILTADNATFNKNLIGIQIDKYDKNQNNYPFTIQNCLFTSRTISFSPLSWPLTNTVKNSTNVIAPLQTPYVDNSLYAPMAIFSPILSYIGFPTNGLVLNAVGYTSANFTYKGISIGQNGPPNFNCFDNLIEDITALATNLTVFNSVFQNGIRTGGKSTSTGGRAIVATATSGKDEGFSTNQIQIINGIPNGGFNCRFYEKTAAADITGYVSTNILYADVRSLGNNSNSFNVANYFGNRGFNIKTRRYYNITIQNNTLYNIKNAMLVSLDAGILGFARSVGYVDVSNNLINRSPVVPVAAEYVNIGLAISDLFPSQAVSFFPGAAVYVNASNNNFKNVLNGIDIKNIAFCGVSIVTNTIGLVNEPNNIFLAQPAQNGINAEQLQKPTLTIHQNSVTGVPSPLNGMKAISTSLNNFLSVRCNTTGSTYYGLNFNGSQPVTVVEDNIMQNQTYGLSLTNTAMIGPQGSAVYPTNNQWLGSWTGNFKTMNYDVLSSAQNSKIYATWYNSTLDPNGFGTFIGFANPNDIYFHNPPPNNAFNTIQSSATVAPSCRLGGGGPNNGNPNANLNNSLQVQLMENILTNAVPSGSLAATTRFIQKNAIYKAIKANPTYTAASAILANFSATAQAGCMQVFCNIEDTLNAGSITSASVMVQNFTPANFVETNFKNFYKIYLSTKDNSYSNNDSVNLENLTSLCPHSDGSVVYQARALYHNIYNTFRTYNDLCGNNVINNRYAPPRFAKDEIAVDQVYKDIKSLLFPNPNNGEFSIYLSDSFEKMPIEVWIYDMAGQEIIDAGRILPSGDHYRIKAELYNGTFIVKVKIFNGKVNVHKLIIAK